jgi:glycine/D-amino acid oxidase-like deaminating enzyme
MQDECQVVVIGGGFYGLSIALYLRDTMGINNIVVLEKENSLMSRASYVNQARVHNGYHYPRSILTAYRSAANFSRFVEDYRPAIVNDFDKYYAVSRVLSKVNSHQFSNFVHKIGVDIGPAEDSIRSIFNQKLVESVYKVKEFGFNSHVLRDLLIERINSKPGIMIKLNEQVEKIESEGSGITVTTDKTTYITGKVLNCTYSQINNLHRKSGLSLVSLKHEIAEMALVKLPNNMSRFSITVMDGPFFSIMPFPTKGLHTLSHVRYTPHRSWIDDETTVDKGLFDSHAYFAKNPIKTQFTKMYADVIRYAPGLSGMEYVESISEVKTVLLKSEGDDSRPILFKSDFAIKGYACIMGGKLDNIYDVFDEIEKFYENE